MKIRFNQWLLIIFAVALIVILYLIASNNRYEVVGNLGGTSLVRVLDKWTGETVTK